MNEITMHQRSMEVQFQIQIQESRDAATGSKTMKTKIILLVSVQDRVIYEMK